MVKHHRITVQYPMIFIMHYDQSADYLRLCSTFAISIFFFFQFAQSYPSTGKSTKLVEPEYFDSVITTTAEHRKLYGVAVGEKPDIGGAMTNGLSLITSGCSRHHGHGGDVTFSGSPELPALTPDIGFSCFHFPEFSRKIIIGNKEADTTNNTQSPSSLEHSYCKCALKSGHNDYMREVDENCKEPLIKSISVDDSVTESDDSSQLLLPPDKQQTVVNPGDSSPMTYCKLSQLPPPSPSPTIVPKVTKPRGLGGSTSRLNSSGGESDDILGSISSDSESYVITAASDKPAITLSDHENRNSKYDEFGSDLKNAEFGSVVVAPLDTYTFDGLTHPDATSIDCNYEQDVRVDPSSEAADLKHVPPKPSLQRTDSYPYSKLAMGTDGVPRFPVVDTGLGETNCSELSLSNTPHNDIYTGGCLTPTGQCKKHNVDLALNETPIGHLFTGSKSLHPEITCLSNDLCGSYARSGDSSITQVPSSNTTQQLLQSPAVNNNIEPYILISQL